MPPFGLQDVFYILGVGTCFGLLWSIHNKLHDILQELRYLNEPRTLPKQKPRTATQSRVPLGGRVYVNTPTGYDDSNVVY